MEYINSCLRNLEHVWSLTKTNPYHVSLKIFLSPLKPENHYSLVSVLTEIEYNISPFSL